MISTNPLKKNGSSGLFLSFLGAGRLIKGDAFAKTDVLWKSLFMNRVSFASFERAFRAGALLLLAL